MLILTRQEGERLVIGEAVVTVTRIRGGRVRLGIEAPREVVVRREELESRPIYRGPEVTT